MYSLEIVNKANVERTIQLALDRADAEGVILTRNQVLEHLKFTDDEDVSQWDAVVDQLMAQRAGTFTYERAVA